MNYLRDKSLTSWLGSIVIPSLEMAKNFDGS